MEFKESKIENSFIYYLFYLYIIQKLIKIKLFIYLIIFN